MNKLLTDKTNRILREIDLLYSDPVFDVELASRCNMNCIMCPRTKIRREFTIMPLGLIRALIDWLPDNAKVMIGGLGEPLLNQAIFFLIAALNNRNIEVGLTTNGLLLTDKTVDALINSGLKLLQISFNGADEKTYSSIMRNGSFFTVIRNLQYLSALKITGLSIKLAVTVQEENKEDIDNIKRLADNLGFDVFLRNRHSRAGTLSSAASKSVDRFGCGIFPKVHFIATNGDILSCCQDLEGKIVLGNIAKHVFPDILEKKRHLINNDHWFPMCKFCDDEYRYLLLADDII